MLLCFCVNSRNVLLNLLRINLVSEDVCLFDSFVGCGLVPRQHLHDPAFDNLFVKKKNGCCLVTEIYQTHLMDFVAYRFF